VNDEINPKTLAGAKKLSMQLNPPSAITYMAAVLEHGAAKYGMFNWRHSSVPLMTYIGAMYRHLAALLDGEGVDPESGLPHEAHIMAGCAIVIDAAHCGTLVDDRPPPGGTGFNLSYYSEKGHLPPIPPGRVEVEMDPDLELVPEAEPESAPDPSPDLKPEEKRRDVGWSRSIPGGLSAAAADPWPYETFHRP